MKKLIAVILFIFPLLLCAEEIKILTWNVFMIPQPLNFTRQRDRGTIIAEQLSNTDYDLIFFQEAFSEGARRKFRRGLVETYPYLLEPKGGRKIYHVLGSGLFVASRYPIKALEQKTYKACSHNDCLGAKMAFLIEVTLPSGKKLQFLNTHLQAWNSEKAIKSRTLQLQTIKEVFERHRDPMVPQILVGDLNINGKLPLEYQNALKMLNMQSEQLSGELTLTNGFKVNCFKIPFGDPDGEWLDHVWINPLESGARVLTREAKPFFGQFKKRECHLSDHYGVESIIEI